MIIEHYDKFLSLSLKSLASIFLGEGTIWKLQSSLAQLILRMPFSLIDLVEGVLALSFNNIFTFRYTHLHPHLMKINTLILLFLFFLLQVSVWGSLEEECWGAHCCVVSLMCGVVGVGVVLRGLQCLVQRVGGFCSLQTVPRNRLSSVLGAVLWCRLEDSSRLGFTELSSLFPFKDFHSFGILFIFSIQLHHTALIIFYHLELFTAVGYPMNYIRILFIMH